MAYLYPYGDTQQLNLDWLIEQWNEVKSQIDGSLQAEIDRVEAAITDLLTARNEAVAAQTAAQASAQAAAGSASTASGAASTATAQAQAAAGSAATAGAHASDAQGYAATAQQSAQAANNSAGAAAVSEGNARNSETAAAGSSSAAAGNALYAEGYAKGTQNGTPVTSGSPYYQNNAKYYSDQAAQDASDAADVLDSIPADYTTLSNDVSNLKTASSTAVSNAENLQIPFTIQGTGMIKYADGTVASSTTSSHTDYVDVSEFTHILYKRCGNTGATVLSGIAFYNSSKTYILGISNATSQANAGYLAELYLVAVPDGAKYARFSTFTDTTTYGNFDLYGIPKWFYLKEKTNSLENVATRINLGVWGEYITTCIQGTINRSTGAVTSSNNFIRSGSIRTDSCTAIRFKKNSNFAVRFNTYSAYVAGNQGDYFLNCIISDEPFNDQFVYMTDDFAMVMFAVKKTNGDTISLSDLSTVGQYVEFYTYTDNKLEKERIAADAYWTGLNNISSHRNNPTYVSEIISVGQSYKNHGLEYGQTTILNSSSSTNKIDCSTFIGLCLRGLKYEDTSYYTHSYQNPSYWIANSDYDWSINPFDYQVMSGINKDVKSNVLTAAQLAEWMCHLGWKLWKDDRLANIRPGDIVFFARKDQDTGTWVQAARFLHISHVAMCISREKAPTDDPTWDTSKYPFKHMIIDSRNRENAVGEAVLEVDQNDATAVYANNVNTIVMVARPDLGAI